MADYLILTTRSLIMAAVVFAVICGYANLNGEKNQRKIVWISAIVGIAFSAVVSYFRNATSMIDSAILNGWIYAITLIAFVLYIIFSLRPLAASKSGAVRTFSWLLLGILAAAILAYALPDVWAYPYHVLLSEKTVISTDFLMSMIGMAGGIALVVVVFFAVEISTVNVLKKGAVILLFIELALNAVLRLSGLISVFFQKNIIKSNHALFSYTVFVKNNGDLFIFLSLLAVVLMSVVLIARSVKQNEPYKNPAEHRKIRAKWRNVRRWAVTIMVTCALGVLNLTVVEAMNQTDVTLSPIEEATAVDDENVYVAFDLVNDGHLHRFAYETENGVEIRFIVIQKTGNSYGIGLDACDVCGETGYYEKDGQVVCNLCDVVMNISTIGFKGGCNPIVIPYEIKEGQIIVPISGLLEYESEFK